MRKRFLLALLLTVVTGGASAQTLALLSGEKSRAPVATSERHAWQIPKSAAVAYSGPCDVTPAAIHWWGLRAYCAANIGTTILKVRRASDSATQELVAMPDGSLDVATATTFCAATTCHVESTIGLVDQTGNLCDGVACDLLQATAGLQPQLILGCTGLGASLPCIRFVAASGTCLVTANTSGTSYTQPLTYSTVVKMTFTVSSTSIVNNGTITVNPSLRIGTGAGLVRVNAGANLAQSHADQTWASWQARFDGTSTVTRMNAAEVTGNAGTNGILDSARFAMGNSTACPAGAASTADITEWGVYIFGFDATQRANMETNQRNYWGF